jgi:hypothetical protein
MGPLIGLIIWALFVTAGVVLAWTGLKASVTQKFQVGAGVARAALLGVAGGMAT